MRFRTELNIEPSIQKITYRTPVFMIGSCFSENIGEHLQKYKFPVLINPFGTLYDPVSICHTVNKIISLNPPDTDRYIIHDEIWYHPDFHSKVSGPDRKQLEEQINQRLKDTNQFLSQAEFIFITLGTSLGWEEKSSGKPVANCHKRPSEHFIKSEISVKEGFAVLEETILNLKNFKPGLKVIFTISPVRHTRSGIIENNRSKARLIQMVDYLQKNYADISYFPAYEWMTDDLRDYRFYKQDLVHPNEMAIEYILNKFKECYFDIDTLEIFSRVVKVVKAAEHKSFYPETQKYRDFVSNQLKEINDLKNLMNDLDFRWEEKMFNP